jgi:class 3 adenylate cyclase
MESSYSEFNLADSVERIDEILNGDDAFYEEKDELPSRDTLTFTNGFYVNCSALFVDMRGSSKLSEKHKNPTLAKIYRSYISELVALFRDNANIKEISIEGDCVWGIFDTPYQSNIASVFTTAGQISSLIDILNYKFAKKKISEITVGIGASFGRALMIKAGYKSSGVNEVAWMGALVAEAASLCSYGNRNPYLDKRIMFSNDFQLNLNDNSKKLLEYNSLRNCYHGNIVNISMNKWLNEQKRND